VGTPAGPVRALAPPVTIENEPATMGPVPALGRTHGKVLRELGFSDQVIAAWRTEGTI
jgi:crotonobetainyl-CoA:carnitine CoA-transferase CaiB-like acyl-CoA transferase